MKRQNTYPTKNTINLAMRDQNPIRLTVLMPAILVMALVFSAFSKFAVIDRLIFAQRAEWGAIRAEWQLEKVNKELEDYDRVEKEYMRYFSEALRSDGMPLDCMEVLSLLESRLMPRVKIGSLSFKGNVISLQITGSTLWEASQLIETLDQEPSVASVELFTADTGREASQTSGATIIMTITLQEVAEE